MSHIIHELCLCLAVTILLLIGGQQITALASQIQKVSNRLELSEGAAADCRE